MDIRPEIISDIKYRNNIEDVISSYVTLKRAGSNLIGNCPFHSERTPSFTVFSEAQNFYCFGCGAGGDVITFIMKIENLDYPSAVLHLAKRSGIDISSFEDNRGGTARKTVLEMNHLAAKFYHARLLDQKNPKGLEYLMGKRGFSMPLIKHFGLGYAPDSWSELTGYLKSKGYSDQNLKDGFLASVSSKTGRNYDYFRNRVMVPIIDQAGSVIAFGGRLLDDGEPKYLNSSDTPAFKKSKNLFALNFAKNACQEQLILCEGYMDVIALHGAGFTNSVATLGTAITPDQARLMKRYTKKVIISYDSDAAGQRAADKAFRLLGEVGLETRVLKIRDAKDPDEFIKKYGKLAFGRLLEGTKTEFEHKFDIIISQNDVEEVHGKVKASKAAVELIAGFSSGVERTIYIKQAADRLSLDPKVLENDVEKLRKKNFKEAEKEERSKLITVTAGYNDRINPEYVKDPEAAACEEAILGILLLHPELTGKCSVMGLTPEGFVTAFNKRVFEWIVSSSDGNGGLEDSSLSQVFGDAEAGRIIKMKIRRMQLANNTEEVLAECIAKLLRCKGRKDINDVNDLKEMIESKRRNKQ